MRLRAFVLAALFVQSFSSCSLLAPRSGRDSLVVMSYNVGSLFDAEESGGEYADFSIDRGQWDEARYRRRLELLAQVVLAAAPARKGPDILCLAEIENRGVLESLVAGPLRDSGYVETALVVAPGQAINCGIVSRLPIGSLKAHGLADAKGGLSEGRYMLEAEIRVDGAFPGSTATATRPLELFVCHWKSKLGGAAATEGERRAAAALLASRVADLLSGDPGADILVCGDFNESPDEYYRVGRRYATALMPDSEAAVPGSNGMALLVASEPAGAGFREGRPVLYSPWEASGGYSFLYEGKEERIDGFLLGAGLLDGEGLRLGGFSPLEADFLLDSDGIPRAWSNSSRTGYSDHLPLVLELRAAEGE